MMVESVTLWVKAEVEMEGILETKRVKSSGLSAVQMREKAALGSMLYLLVSLSITLSEDWREATGGAVRSVVNTREPAVEDGTGKVEKALATYRVALVTTHTFSLYHIYTTNCRM